MKSRKNLLLVGGIPNPKGGVSSFVWRFCNRDKGKNVYAVIDPYFDKHKDKIGGNVIHLTSPFSGLLRFFWLFYTLIFFNNMIIHFNFSTCNSLWFCLFMPKRGNRWCLTLHNGNLQFKSKLLKFLSSHILSKFNLIFSLSERQGLFYSHCRVALKKLRCVSSYIFFIRTSETKIGCDMLKPGYMSRKIRAIASGYPTLIYNHTYTLEYFKDNPDKSLCLCLYGPDDDNLLSYLLSFNKYENICVLYDLDSVRFNDILTSGTHYLRPNAVDSFGIVVADAINLGLTVIASAVCKRYDGTIIFNRIEDYFSVMDLEFGKFRDKDRCIVDNTNLIDSYHDYLLAYESCK